MLGRVPARLLFIAAWWLASSLSVSARASDHCTVEYRVDGTLQITDTYRGKGDTIVQHLPGSLVVEYEVDRDGVISDGKVQILHFSMFQRFTIDALVNVTTTLHHFTPTCNGVRAPAWRSPSDPGFPKECRYTGQDEPVATGKLSRERGTITWARCKAAPTYWSNDRNAYTIDDESKGRGCLNELRAVGSIRCDGGLGCKLGGLKKGESPLSDVWNQPLVHGPPDSNETLRVSEDLGTLRTPRGRTDGFQSYNLPNDMPSRVWFSWVATRNDQSPYTTCP